MTDDDDAEADRLRREAQAQLAGMLPDTIRALRKVANSEVDTKERREARRMLRDYGLEGSAD